MNKNTHIWRIFGCLAVVVVLFFIMQWILRPDSYGRIGHYRAESLREIINLNVVHQGKEVCNECHPEIYQIHGKDIHFGVKCEDCHGPGDIHVKYHHGEIDLVSVELAKLPMEYTLEGCLFCHRKLIARPRTFAQVDPVEHYEFLHVTDDRTRCIECHNPHEPLFLLDKVSAARVHPIIYECSDCHDTQMEKNYSEVEGHPVIFVCGDCHSTVVRDFMDHEHSFMKCTSCHLFHRENETSGRIFKNSHKRFCLLCHEQKGFKDKESVPQIVFPEHLTEQAVVMRLDPNDLDNNPTVCLECHFDFVHNTELIQSLEGKIR